MRLFTVLLLVAAGCQVTPAPPSADPALPASSVEVASCRDPEPRPEGEGFELLLAGVARAQTNDLRCGPPDDEFRICRALFILAVIDPAHYLDDPPQFERTSDAARWAVSDALVNAPSEIADALQTILTASEQLTAAPNDAERTAALLARADPAATAALDNYWETQCQ